MPAIYDQNGYIVALSTINFPPYTVSRKKFFLFYIFMPVIFIIAVCYSINEKLQMENLATRIVCLLLFTVILMLLYAPRIWIYWDVVNRGKKSAAFFNRTELKFNMQFAVFNLTDSNKEIFTVFPNGAELDFLTEGKKYVLYQAPQLSSLGPNRLIVLNEERFENLRQTLNTGQP